MSQTKILSQKLRLPDSTFEEVIDIRKDGNNKITYLHGKLNDIDSVANFNIVDSSIQGEKLANDTITFNKLKYEIKPILSDGVSTGYSKLIIN